VGRAGTEHPPKTTDNSRVSSQSGTDSGTPHAEKPELPPDLAELVNAWPTLPAALKAGILAMVKAAKAGGSD